MEIFTANLAAKLAEMGNRVLIVTANTHGLPDKESTDGVEIMRLPCKPLMNGRLPLPNRTMEHQAMMAELAELPIDSILINTRFYPHSILGAKLAEQKGLRPVVLDHGSAYLTLGNPLSDLVLRMYEHVMTNRIKRYDADFYGISAASAQWLTRFGITPMGTITNAMDAEGFVREASDRSFRGELGIPSGSFVVAFTGRLVPEKGVKSLIEAARMLSGVSDAHIVLAGDGPLLDEAQNAGGNVHALGRLSRGDIASLLLEADAFCLPTRSEGFSTSLLEAAACSCVPIITKVGGVDELIPDDSHGMILDNASPEAIATAIAYLSEHPKTAHRMSSNLAQHAKEFDWERTARRLLDAFEDARHSPSSPRI